MSIQPIETFYNGYRFRSRLEARWAVFFDTLKIKYLYEPEGFDLDGLWYLPDFWVPAWNCWLEIKPASMKWPEDYIPPSRLAALSGKEVMLFCGDPWPVDHDIVIFSGPRGAVWTLSDDDDPNSPSLAVPALGLPEPHDLRLYGGWPHANQVARCRCCDGLCLLYMENDDAMSYGNLGPHACGDHERWPYGNESNELMFAYVAARSARFERERPGRR
jgi:hypothetical protein